MLRKLHRPAAAGVELPTGTCTSAPWLLALLAASLADVVTTGLTLTAVAGATEQVAFSAWSIGTFGLAAGLLVILVTKLAGTIVLATAARRLTGPLTGIPGVHAKLPQTLATSTYAAAAVWWTWLAVNNLAYTLTHV